jgi:hypothetical protein
MTAIPSATCTESIAGPYREANAPLIDEGKAAPTFTLPGDSGEDPPLESLRGRLVVLYFNPNDDPRPHC